MDLNTLWFALIGVLFVGFFFLEGFDYGVGILHPFIARTDTERRVVVNTIGPVWDGNEVWMITAGGAMFAAFPHWYATLFSGFYLALVLMLLALIVRGVAFEFRSKMESPVWRAVWDWAIFVGSFVPALLWGVALANLIRGVPIDGTMTYVGGFFNLLNPYALIGGLASLAIFTLHGATFLTLKTGGGMDERARALASKLWYPAAFLLLAFVVATYWMTDVHERLGVDPGVVPAVAVMALVGCRWTITNRRDGWSFVLTAVAIVFATVTVFIALFPRVMVSSLDPEWSLTIYNAASSPYTLKVMSIVAGLLVPVVLVYQGWTYWVFRQRITPQSELHY
ncbi:MAG: cytochrome d ubiquinol oxidase subunit II [Thermoanaerobaculales bacterium]|jgi:cytochrome d ubiquinol oxidase subunit II|nr:cytochrome d ubiquinol oxidase subunit II [Thermoanaerobaculales bacterium]